MLWVVVHLDAAAAGGWRSPGPPALTTDPLLALLDVLDERVRRSLAS